MLVIQDPDMEMRTKAHWSGYDSLLRGADRSYINIRDALLQMHHQSIIHRSQHILSVPRLVIVNVLYPRFAIQSD